MGTALCGIMVVLAAHSVRMDLTDWPYQRITRSKGTMLSVFEGNAQIRLVTFYIGMAARDAAGGAVTRLVAPKDLQTLAVIDGDNEDVGAYSAFFLDQMSGMGLVETDYDVVLSDSALERLRAKGRIVEYPHKVVGVVAKTTDGQVRLFTDARREFVYCVPEALVAEVSR